MSKVRNSRYDKFRQFDKSFANFNDRDMQAYLDLYDRNLDDQFEPASTTLISAGSIMLFCNWLMFNGGSSFSITPAEGSNSPQKVIITTIISGSTASLSTIFFRPLMLSVNKQDETNRFDLLSAAGGLLAGCVSITAACAHVSLLSSALIGLAGCLIFLSSKILWARLHIDDPLEASQIHGLCGLWGVLCVGLFHETAGLITTGELDVLGVQIIGSLAMMGYSYLISTIFFSILVSMNRYRIGDTVELAGMDLLDSAYKADYYLQGSAVTKEQIAALEEKQRRSRLKYNLRVKSR